MRHWNTNGEKGTRGPWLGCLALGLLVAVWLTAGPAAAKGEADYSFIGIKHASQVTGFFTSLQKAVAADDKNAVAGLVTYPITVSLGDEDLEIQSKAEFVGHYDRIMTPAFKQNILDQRLDEIFANKQGVMVGSDGKAWALPDGKVLRIYVIRE